METHGYFKQKTISLKDVKSKGFVYSEDLLSLISSEELRNAISNKYDLSESIKIELDKIDSLFDAVKRYSSRFTTSRLNVSFDQVVPSFQTNADGKEVVYFDIAEANDFQGEVFNNLKAESIYDSVSMFFDNRKLTQYVNFLKGTDGGSFLLDELDRSWKAYYLSSNKKIEKKVFRLLDDGDELFLKSINTERFKEYGIAETFVLTCLELFKISKSNNSPQFTIGSIALSESTIDFIISVDNPHFIEGLGHINSSISIRNQDQGNTSIGFYSSLEFNLEKVVDGKLFLFPNKKVEGIKHELTINHTVAINDFIDSYSSIGGFFQDYDKFKDDYFLFKASTDPDELRAKIEEKVISPNSPFRGINELVDLFKKDKAGHISNLAALLRICGKAEMLDVNFDVKFKLRYLISNVLLYGKNDLI
ncbi:hypothetical protein [Pedobacter kyonggii]|uniref:Uncharacterized protein n=1 Tax=Pedobacter kyonggii TaxID=1926871 RepID=A0A4Q9HAS8_9SPHI|nr:hypothetical protein [Pedobacter kyonggii]TBO41194.1 hypothetical protein EYS08_15660 [Pedobacter kyonggii]